MRTHLRCRAALPVLMATSLFVIAGSSPAADGSAAPPRKPNMELRAPAGADTAGVADLQAQFERLKAAREQGPEAMAQGNLGAACGTQFGLDAYLRGRYAAALAARNRRLAREGATQPAGAGTTVPAAGAIRNRDGIWIVEADDTMLNRDRPVDLEGMSLRFVPNGTGYDVSVVASQYESDAGTAILSSAVARTYVPFDLASFTFPLGGVSRTRLYAGTDLMIRSAWPVSETGTAPALGNFSNAAQTSAFSPAFTATAPVQTASVTFAASHTGNYTSCVEVALLAPGGAVQVLKAFGAAYAGPYDVQAFYDANGAGTYTLRVTEQTGAACFGLASLASASMTVASGGSLADQFDGDQYDGFSAPADLLKDQADRLGPLFWAAQHLPYDFVCGNIYLRQDGSKALITWRSAASPVGRHYYVDVQAKLLPSGEIVFSYNQMEGADNGAPAVLTRLPAWWAAFTSNGSAADPDEGFTGPLELTQLQVREDPGTDLTHITVTVQDPIPAAPAQEHTYYLLLSQGGQVRHRFYAWVNAAGLGDLYLYDDFAGAWTMIGKPTFIANRWEIFFSAQDLPNLTPGAGLTLDMYDYLGGGFLDAANAVLPWGGAGMPFVRDYSAGPFTATGPILEAFTFPEFLPHGVRDALLATTTWPTDMVDTLPMYQAFFTDIIFYAGAYYTDGNCGAAGVGMCDPGQGKRPGLLHMNKTNYGWNDANLRPDGWITVLSHEGGHHWLQYVAIEENGSNTYVLNPESAHPAAYVDTRAYVPWQESYDCGPMGGSRWTSNGNGTFTSTPDFANITYSGYDLYLMGLLPAADVPNWFYLANCNPPVPLSYWPASNTTVSATQKNVTLSMLTAAMGARVPDAASAPHDFFMPLVLLVRPGEEPSQEDWDFMLKVRDGYAAAFHAETADLGTTSVVSPRELSPDSPDAVPFILTKNGANLRFTFEDPEFPAGELKYNLYRGDLEGDFFSWTPWLCAQDPVSDGNGGLYLDAEMPGESTWFLVTMSGRRFEGAAGYDSDGNERLPNGGWCNGYAP